MSSEQLQDHLINKWLSQYSGVFCVTYNLSNEVFTTFGKKQYISIYMKTRFWFLPTRFSSPPTCHVWSSTYGHQIISAGISCLGNPLVFQCYVDENKIKARNECFTWDTREHEASSSHRIKVKVNHVIKNLLDSRFLSGRFPMYDPFIFVLTYYNEWRGQCSINQR